MIDQASVPSLMGSTVRDSAGEKIGKVGRSTWTTRRGSRSG